MNYVYTQILIIGSSQDDNNPEAIVEYEKEMIMMTQLKHTNIVQLKGLCTDSPPYFILSEYMEQVLTPPIPITHPSHPLHTPHTQPLNTPHTPLTHPSHTP